ncbi:hypothetical protein FB45DRAFT_1040587 [Roridomyces roridus]|uniref:Uncharacterized protein n=1 Tax=Roridomyces roridus TaxID=1738132 RepID=A0AAD7F9G9_9AGAR|nr:hypothetical protein FB45DRAFT_1040587 [Roridomyces roridus]
MDSTLGPTIIKKVSKASHTRSASHRQAFQMWTNRNAVPEPEAPRAVPLSFIDILGSRSEEQHVPEPGQRPPSPSSHPLYHVTQYDDEFFDQSGEKILFSAGHLPDADLAERREIQAQINRAAILPSHSMYGHFSEELQPEEPNGESTVDGAFAAAMERMGIADESDDEEEFGFARIDEEEAWFPHGSRTMFMLDLLDNLPRLRLSDDHLKAIIWVMRECQTPNVPSFSVLRRKQASLTRELGITSELHTSSLGNHFYMNHPAKLLALGLISSFASGKWVSETDLDNLSPMWADWGNISNAHRHFYIKELAQLHDGSYVLLLRWVTLKGVIHVDVQDVQVEQTSGCEKHLFNIKTGSFRQITATSLRRNYLDIEASGIVEFTEYSPRYCMPHPMREKAQGRPVFRLRIMPWSDDVSGNVSKQYNAHTNMYVTNLNLPHQKLQQEYFIRFSSTSPHASSSEQFVALGEDCAPGVWHHAYDCELEQEILFDIIPHVLPADNPQQSETSSHIGMGGNLGCRRDYTGGTKEICETDEGYDAFYKPGIPRKPEQTIQAIRWQIWLACTGNDTDVKASSAATGVKDKISQHWVSVLLEKAKTLQHERLTVGTGITGDLFGSFVHVWLAGAFGSNFARASTLSCLVGSHHSSGIKSS